MHTAVNLVLRLWVGTLHCGVRVNQIAVIGERLVSVSFCSRIKTITCMESWTDLVYDQTATISKPNSNFIYFISSFFFFIFIIFLVVKYFLLILFNNSSSVLLTSRYYLEHQIFLSSQAVLKVFCC